MERSLRDAQAALERWMPHNPNDIPPLRLAAWQLRSVDAGVLFPGRASGPAWALEAVPAWATGEEPVAVAVALGQLPADMSARETAALLLGNLHVVLDLTYRRQWLLGARIVRPSAPAGTETPPPEGPAGAPSSGP